MNLNIPRRREFYSRALTEPEGNLRGVGAWIDAKIVFQFLAVAVEVEGNPAIKLAVANIRIEGNIANPPRCIVPEEVIAVSGKRFLSIRLRIGSHECQMNGLIAVVRTSDGEIHGVAQEHGL